MFEILTILYASYFKSYLNIQFFLSNSIKANIFIIKFDLTGPISMNRRSTTPMGTVNKGIASKKINFSKPEDSIYASK